MDKGSLDSIVFYDKPILKFERLIDTYLSYAPRGFGSFVKAMPVWLKEKLYLKKTLRQELATLLACSESELPPILFAEHHESHAASAFYPGPFDKAAVLCLDGVGEWATTSAWIGDGAKLTPLWQIDFPHSLGLLYSAFTYYLGFKVNSGEYKLMGLAPYGKPTYVNKILDNLVDVKPDGTFYIFPKALEEDANAFCMKAKDYDLILVPSDSFGVPGYFRMAYCIDTEKVERSIAAFEKFVHEVYGR